MGNYIDWVLQFTNWQPDFKPQPASNKEAIQIICDWYRDGQSSTMIGKQLKVSTQTVLNVLNKEGVKTRKRGGANNYKPLHIPVSEFNLKTDGQISEEWKQPRSEVKRHRDRYREKGWLNPKKVPKIKRDV